MKLFAVLIFAFMTVLVNAYPSGDIGKLEDSAVPALRAPLSSIGGLANLRSDDSNSNEDSKGLENGDDRIRAPLNLRSHISASVELPINAKGANEDSINTDGDLTKARSGKSKLEGVKDIAKGILEFFD